MLKEKTSKGRDVNYRREKCLLKRKRNNRIKTSANAKNKKIMFT